MSNLFFTPEAVNLASSVSGDVSGDVGAAVGAAGMLGVGIATGNPLMAANGALSALTFVYHRFLEPQPPPPPPSHTVAIPRVDGGAPYPLLFGTCRVRQPILAWNSPTIAWREVNQGDQVSGLYPAPTNNSYLYFMSQF